MRRGRPRTTEVEFDPIAVERLVAGRHAGTPATAADGWEAVRRLALWHKLTDGQIALRTGYTRRNVLRIRGALEIPPVVPARGANRYSAPVAAERISYRAA